MFQKHVHFKTHLPIRLCRRIEPTTYCLDRSHSPSLNLVSWLYASLDSGLKYQRNSIAEMVLPCLACMQYSALDDDGAWVWDPLDVILDLGK